jgi:hypothetical protein
MNKGKPKRHSHANPTTSNTLFMAGDRLCKHSCCSCALPWPINCISSRRFVAKHSDHHRTPLTRPNLNISQNRPHHSNKTTKCVPSSCSTRSARSAVAQSSMSAQITKAANFRRNVRKRKREEPAFATCDLTSATDAHWILSTRMR